MLLEPLAKSRHQVRRKCHYRAGGRDPLRLRHAAQAAPRPSSPHFPRPKFPPPETAPEHMKTCVGYIWKKRLANLFVRYNAEVSSPWSSSTSLRGPLAPRRRADHLPPVPRRVRGICPCRLNTSFEHRCPGIHENGSAPVALEQYPVVALRAMAFSARGALQLAPPGDGEDVVGHPTGLAAAVEQQAADELVRVFLPEGAEGPACRSSRGWRPP